MLPLLSMICIVASVAAIGMALDLDDHWWLPKLTVALAILSLLVVTFVPSTKQMAAIIVLPKLANSEKIQTVGNRLYDLAVEWMDELKPKKAKETDK